MSSMPKIPYFVRKAENSWKVYTAKADDSGLKCFMNTQFKSLENAQIDVRRKIQANVERWFVMPEMQSTVA